MTNRGSGLETEVMVLEIFLKWEQWPSVLDGLCLYLPGGQILNHYQMYGSIIPEIDVITPEV